MQAYLGSQRVDKVLQAAQHLLLAKGAKERLKSLSIQFCNEKQNGWISISLPNWAMDIAPNDKTGLIVPKWGNKNQNWENYDWWRGAHSMLTCTWQRDHELRNGPTHSYSSRLGVDIQPVFDHAWVNRIILFLRRWWAHNNHADEKIIFGEIPSPVIFLTHDVDAVEKTFPIRLKQTLFNIYNRQFSNALRFLFGDANYWQFEKIIELEHAHNRRSIWNFYGGRARWLRSPKEILFDPSYNVLDPNLLQLLQNLLAKGHEIGLHPKFDSWEDFNRMKKEKTYIESACGIKITHVRQHWLRFSFKKTWVAQAKAGLKHDMTLGFNDRPGFRNSAALSFIDTKSNMQITPMVLMDSHLYDYQQMSNKKRCEEIDKILLELKETGGKASIIWHQRVFHSDYGWGESYAYLLRRMDELGFAN